MSKIDSKIGPKIRAFRRQLGMQANKLAEELNISPSYLNLIEKGKRKAEQTWEFFRSWSQIRVERPKHPWYPAHILVASKGERIPIGSFLTQEEKNTLVERLREIINQLSS